MKLGPYAGVSGVTDPDFLRMVANWRPDMYPRRISVGLLVTSTTLHGGTSPWHPERHIRVKDLPEFCKEFPGVVTTVHYWAPQERTSHLAVQLGEVMQLSQGKIQGIQLNIPWAPADQIRRFREAHPTCLIIQQIGGEMIRMCGRNPQRLTERVAADYSDVVHDVLLDASGGEGKLIDYDWSRECLMRLRDAMPTMGLGAAGALGPRGESIEVFGRLVKDIPELSCDAESGLMKGPDDGLDSLKALGYLGRVGKCL